MITLRLRNANILWNGIEVKQNNGYKWTNLPNRNWIPDLGNKFRPTKGKVEAGGNINVQVEIKTYTVTYRVSVYIYWRRQWHPTPVLLPGKSHGRRRLVGCRPWGLEEQDTTERLHFHFSLSCIGEGNGNPLQRSWLENPRGGGAWWAAVYGVTQSRTRLKWLSSSRYMYTYYIYINIFLYIRYVYLGLSRQH